MNDDHSPLWQQMILHVEEAGPAGKTVLDYGCNQGRAGFAVSARPCAYQGLVPLKRTSIYFPRIADSLQYHPVDKTLFRLVSA